MGELRKFADGSYVFNCECGRKHEIEKNKAGKLEITTYQTRKDERPADDDAEDRPTKRKPKVEEPADDDIFS